LKVERRLTIADTGSHSLDVIRFFFGEAQEIYCRTQRIRSDIAGEDVATIMLRCGDVTVLNELSNSTRMYDDPAYPQMVIEGTSGTLELLTEHRVRLTTAEGTRIERHAPPVYTWSLGAHPWLTSIVPCHANLLQAIRVGNASLAETNSADNLKTMRLVYAAYDSAERNELIMCS
jgi:predicted dehydrogenase